MSVKIGKTLKIPAFIAFAVLSIYIFKVFTPEKMRAIIESKGEIGPLVYIILWTLLPIGFFPVPALALAGGIGFGFLMGCIYTLIGAMLNISLMFLGSRYIARDFIRAYLRRKSVSFHSLLCMDDRKLEISLLVARLIPIIPYNIINYGFGLTDIGFWRYLMISMIGIVPGTLVFLSMGNFSLDIRSKGFLYSTLAFTALIVISTYVGRKLKE